MHPTQKPVTLAGKAMINSCPESGIVLDLFAGSGSTMVAGEQADRPVYMMEIDPVYCHIILDRMHKFNPEIRIEKNGSHYIPENVEAKSRKAKKKKESNNQ